MQELESYVNVSSLTEIPFFVELQILKIRASDGQNFFDITVKTWTLLC